MNFNKIDNVTIPVDNNWSDIAISLSGGADSALLTYLLCNIVHPSVNFHIISHTRMWKTKPWQSYDSKVVLLYFQEKFPNRKFIKHTGFVAPEFEYSNTGPSLTDEYGKKVSGDNIQIRAFSEYICVSNNINAYYNAVTRNPREINLGGMPERNIEKTEDNTHLEIMDHLGVKVLHPFRFIEKSWIIKQYKKFNILDLFNLTRSCEGEFQGLDYTTYTPGQIVPICGKCFWCKEREWAIEQTIK